LAAVPLNRVGSSYSRGWSTIAASGVPGFESLGWFGIVAPAKTPPAVIEKLNKAFVKTLADPAVVEKIIALGSDPMPMTADDGGNDLIASWSPSSDRLAVIHNVEPDVEMHVVNADGTGEVSITDNDTFEYIGPQAWGP
jgi:hypothetical protein